MRRWIEMAEKNGSKKNSKLIILAIVGIVIFLFMGLIYKILLFILVPGKIDFSIHQGFYNNIVQVSKRVKVEQGQTKYYKINRSYDIDSMREIEQNRVRVSSDASGSVNIHCNEKGNYTISIIA